MRFHHASVGSDVESVRIGYIILGVAAVQLPRLDPFAVPGKLHCGCSIFEHRLGIPLQRSCQQLPALAKRASQVTGPTRSTAKFQQFGESWHVTYDGYAHLKFKPHLGSDISGKSPFS